jgi:hypothetical protein
MICTSAVQNTHADIAMVTKHQLTVTEPHAFFRETVNIRCRDFSAEATDITETEV